MECNRDEAKRAKEIAEHRFSTKDVRGAKKFASKAHSLYPDLDGISQFLAVLDVYVAAENKINGELDFYGILGLNPLADDDTVRKHYRKLALSLHPDKNKSIGAEGAFQFVSEAWTLLSDKEKRSVYDHKRNGGVSKQRVRTQNGDSRPPKPPTHNGFHSVTKSSATRTRVTSTKANGRSNSQKGGINATTKTDTLPTKAEKRPAKTETGPAKTEMGPTKTETVLGPSSAETETGGAKTEMGLGPSPTKTKTGLGQSPTKTGLTGVFSSSNKTTVPKSFWTVCKRCKLKYEFLRKYLNQNLLCPTCHGPFHATETAPLNIYGSLEGSENTKGSNQETGKNMGFDPGRSTSTKWSQFLKKNGPGAVKRDREETHIREEALRRKICKTKQDDNGHLEDKKSRPIEVKKDVASTRCIKNELIKKATMEIKKKLNEWSSESVKDSSVADNGTEPLVNDVPDPEFHDFDAARSEKCFKEGQVWAVYDDHDGMPRLYALIKKVISLDPFKMNVCWYDPKPDNHPGRAAFGEFKPGKHEVVSAPNYFSHKASFTKQTSGSIHVFPRKGDVCALYRNDETSNSSYEIVEVDAYDEETGTTVTPLVKVCGFRTVFHRHLDPKETRVILEKESSMFSHEIPACVLTGEESGRAPKGCLELDPAAVPPQFLEKLDDIMNMDVDDDDDERG